LDSSKILYFDLFKLKWLSFSEHFHCRTAVTVWEPLAELSVEFSLDFQLVTRAPKPFKHKSRHCCTNRQADRLLTGKLTDWMADCPTDWLTKRHLDGQSLAMGLGSDRSARTARDCRLFPSAKRNILSCQIVDTRLSFLSCLRGCCCCKSLD